MHTIRTSVRRVSRGQLVAILNFGVKDDGLNIRLDLVEDDATGQQYLRATGAEGSVILDALGQAPPLPSEDTNAAPWPLEPLDPIESPEL